MIPLGDALKVPGSKFASEFHGTKEGRYLGKMDEGKWKRKRCSCGGHLAFDQNEEPFCESCGRGLKNANRMQMQSSKFRRRMRSRKKFMTVNRELQ